MDQPSSTNEKTDCADAPWKTRNFYSQGSKSTTETPLQVDNQTPAKEKRNHTGVKDGSKTQMSSQVEARPGIHSFDRRPDRRPPSVEQAVSSEMPNVQTRNICALLVLLVAVIVGISWAFYPSCWPILSSDNHIITSKEETGKDSPFVRLTERFHNLQPLFPGQMKRLWTVCRAAIRPLLDRPKRPAVILLAGSKRTTAATDCMALRMSEVVKDVLEAEAPVVVFDCRRYRDWEAHEAKREMDKQLTEAFENGAKVGVVLAVESLPGNSPMIFYRFCDTANAPFKNVVLILTLNMEQEATSDRDSEAHEEMSRLWSPVLDPEQVDPLFSRIGNSVAYVREETDLSHCPKMN